MLRVRSIRVYICELLREVANCTQIHDVFLLSTSKHFVEVFVKRFLIQYNIDVIDFFYTINKVDTIVIFHAFMFSFLFVRSSSITLLQIEESQNYSSNAIVDVIFRYISCSRELHEVYFFVCIIELE